MVSKQTEAGERLRAIREEYEDALAVSIQAAVEAVKGGMSEAEAARVTGIDRMTVRKALGKR